MLRTVKYINVAQEQKKAAGNRDFMRLWCCDAERDGRGELSVHPTAIWGITANSLTEVTQESAMKAMNR